MELKNEESTICSKDDYLIFSIQNCSDEQIKLYDKNYYYYCEDPLCNNDCPISNKRAKCIKGSNSTINSININKCICEKGWKGEKCLIKDYIKIT